MPAKKSKPMTAREKKWRAERRKEWRELGIIPPVKQRLNRKKYLEEALQERDDLCRITDHGYLLQALGIMLAPHRATLEAVGAAKVIKLAIAIRDYEQEQRDAGHDTYKVSDLYETRIAPILDA